MSISGLNVASSVMKKTSGQVSLSTIGFHRELNKLATVRLSLVQNMYVRFDLATRECLC